MKRTGWKTFCVAGLIMMSSLPVYAADTGPITTDIDRLKMFVEQGHYDQAFNLIDVIRKRLYETMVTQKPPEIIGNVYKQYYYQFMVANPVAEWKIEQVKIQDEIFKKKNQLVRDLVKIVNPASPYGLIEQVVISAYDVGKSSEAATVSELDFKPELYLKRVADSMIKAQLKKETDLIQKGDRRINGNDAYEVVMQEDMGYNQTVRTINIYMYNAVHKYILIISFVMYAENYPIYKYILDDILDTLVFGDTVAKETPHVAQKSFMDIYLSRSAKKVQK